jgi:NADH-quinone oxidoreductase subunit C
MLEALKERFGDAIASVEEVGEELRVRVAPEALVEVCSFCKGEGLDYPADITAVDTGKELLAVYRLGSVTRDSQVVVSVALPRSGARLPSLCGVYRGAEWPEREVYDLFGIRFDGHPNLTRILLTDDWEGHPLLKQGK